LIAQGKVDGNRVYVSGCSAGGQETHSYLLEYPNLFAAAIPTCPLSGSTLTAASLATIKHIPIWYIHANTDRSVAPVNSQTPYERLLALNPRDVRRTLFPNTFGTEIPNADYATSTYDGHWSWVMLLNNVFVADGGKPGSTEGTTPMDWLFAQTKAVVAGITTAPHVDIDGTKKVSYQVNLSQVKNANVFEISAQFDASKLSYVNYELALPSAAAISAKYNETTGEFTLTFALAGAGLTYTSEIATPVLTVNFAVRDSVKVGDTVESTLTSFEVTTTDGITADKSTATLNPSIAGFTATNYLRYDADGDGAITTKDISLIIYNYYLTRRGQLGWDKALIFDANGDGIIDLVDIITVSTYIK
jgi:hypothetical protein